MQYEKQQIDFSAMMSDVDYIRNTVLYTVEGPKIKETNEKL